MIILIDFMSKLVCELHFDIGISHNHMICDISAIERWKILRGGGKMLREKFHNFTDFMPH